MLVLKIKNKNELMAVWNAIAQFIDNSEDCDSPQVQAEVAAADELLDRLQALIAAKMEEIG